MTVEVSPAMWMAHPFVKRHKCASNVFSRSQMAAYKFDAETMMVACRTNEFYDIADCESGFVEMGHA